MYQNETDRTDCFLVVLIDSRVMKAQGEDILNRAKDSYNRVKDANRANETISSLGLGEYAVSICPGDRDSKDIGCQSSFNCILKGRYSLTITINNNTTVCQNTLAVDNFVKDFVLKLDASKLP